MNDYEFIQIANIIIEDHNCRAVMIDIDNRVINIEGPEDQQVKCAQALADQLPKITHTKQEHTTILHGWPNEI